MSCRYCVQTTNYLDLPTAEIPISLPSLDSETMKKAQKFKTTIETGKQTGFQDHIEGAFCFFQVYRLKSFLMLVRSDFLDKIIDPENRDTRSIILAKLFFRQADLDYFFKKNIIEIMEQEPENGWKMLNFLARDLVSEDCLVDILEAVEKQLEPPCESKYYKWWADNLRAISSQHPKFSELIDFLKPALQNKVIELTDIYSLLNALARKSPFSGQEKLLELLALGKLPRNSSLPASFRANKKGITPKAESFLLEIVRNEEEHYITDTPYEALLSLMEIPRSKISPVFKIKKLLVSIQEKKSTFPLLQNSFFDLFQKISSEQRELCLKKIKRLEHKQDVSQLLADSSNLIIAPHSATFQKHFFDTLLLGKFDEDYLFAYSDLISKNPIIKAAITKFITQTSTDLAQKNYQTNQEKNGHWLTSDKLIQKDFWGRFYQLVINFGNDEDLENLSRYQELHVGHESAQDYDFAIQNQNISFAAYKRFQNTKLGLADITDLTTFTGGFSHFSNIDSFVHHFNVNKMPDTEKMQAGLAESYRTILKNWQTIKGKVPANDFDAVTALLSTNMAEISSGDKQNVRWFLQQYRQVKDPHFKRQIIYDLATNLLLQKQNS